jgi:hypothetical protein
MVMAEMTVIVAVTGTMETMETMAGAEMIADAGKAVDEVAAAVVAAEMPVLATEAAAKQVCKECCNRYGRNTQAASSKLRSTIIVAGASMR